MKSRMKLVALSGIFLMSLLMFIPGTMAASHPTFSISASPSSGFVGVNQTFYVNGTEASGYSNYTIVAYVSGNNLTGMNPATSYENFYGSSNNFSIKMKAPTTAQTINVLVESFAQFEGTTVAAYENISVTIVNTLNFSAVVYNPTGITIRNLTVYFMLNGVTIGDRTISNISSDQSATVNYSYVPNPSQFKHGEYTLEIKTNNPLVQSSTSTGSVQKFYYGTPPNYNWVFYVAAIVIIVMVFLALSAGRRGGGAAGLPSPKWRR